MLIDIHSHKTKPEQDVFRFYSTSDWKSFTNNGYTRRTGIGLSMGIHPWEALTWKQTEQDALCGVLSQQEVMMIGEIGLDRVCRVPFHLQQSIFHFQLEVAAAYGKPVLLHVVKSMNELLAIKKTIKNIPAWIIHGFRGGPKTAAQFLSAGFFLSFGKFHNPASLQLCPADRLFLETDEDGDIHTLYEVAAGVRGISLDDLEFSIEQNFHALFPITPSLL